MVFHGQNRLIDEVEGGGGFPVVRAFPFAFDTDDLADGVAVYTPTVGDVVLDAWIVVEEEWDGTTPLADIGFFETPAGFFGDIGAGPVDLLATYHTAGDRLSTGQPSFAVGPGGVHLPITMPAVFLTEDPIKIVVSTTGRTDGADPGSTQGSATLYLVTANPL